MLNRIRLIRWEYIILIFYSLIVFPILFVFRQSLDFGLKGTIMGISSTLAGFMFTSISILSGINIKEEFHEKFNRYHRKHFNHAGFGVMAIELGVTFTMFFKLNLVSYAIALGFCGLGLIEFLYLSWFLIKLICSKTIKS